MAFKYDDYKEFYEDISQPIDLEFYYKGRHHWLGAQAGENKIIVETPNVSENYYANADSLLENHYIDEILFKDLWRELEVI